jgi:hypothetical protein
MSAASRAELARAQATFDALADVQAVRNGFVGVQLDSGAGRRAAEFRLSDLMPIGRQTATRDSDDFVAFNAPHGGDHRLDANHRIAVALPPRERGMKPDHSVRNVVAQFEAPPDEIVFYDRPTGVDGRPTDFARTLDPALIVIEGENRFRGRLAGRDVVHVAGDELDRGEKVRSERVLGHRNHVAAAESAAVENMPHLAVAR